MNTAQISAADPRASVWVAASAGTGKTKVLTDRVLALLLQGFAPERILCLTFTRAAAAEMASRLTQRLAKWAALPLSALISELENLSGRPPSETQVARARQLFTLVLDTPGGMKIQTLHGFCQSILGRFPLEAAVPPHFRVTDDQQASEMWAQAQRSVFLKPSPQADGALALLTPYMGDIHFSTLLDALYKDRPRIQKILASYEGREHFAASLLKFLKVDSLAPSLEECLADGLVPRLITQFVPAGTDYETYISAFLTKEGDIRKKIPEGQAQKAEDAYRFSQSLKALEIARRTLAFLILFEDILAAYEDIKVRRCVLDYEDLIQKTQTLLAHPGIAAWILYKLDGGIDHLLIDEAQDTNAVQWQIILSLTADFFTPDKPYRTLFAVGDAKQSIYSFQGANPQEFLDLKSRFARLVQDAGQEWQEVQLNISYRSTPAILQMVDEVFSTPRNCQGVSFGDASITHQAFRDHHPGVVELWPLVEPVGGSPEKPAGEWRLPLKRVEWSSPQSRLAQFMATQIAGWLAARVILPSTGAPVQPRDILILMRRRSILGHEILRALEKCSIPVAGADRLNLTEHIAVMDLLALGQFVLLPEDDLNLACVLRSPLIGLSEDDLYSLAQGRDGTLWASLSQKAAEKASFAQALEWLKSSLYEADMRPVYEFYSWVLNQGNGRTRFLSRLGNEAEDVLEEFLTQALVYGQSHAGGLQGFIHFMTSQAQEIKRDASDTAHNQVRIMTVHGSKGLQAPVVILPDAADAGIGKEDALLWRDNLFLVRPRRQEDIPQTRLLKDRHKRHNEDERRRLLYVALTRAQDRLYMGGCASGRDMADDCWYRLIQDALTAKGQGETLRYTSGDTDMENAAPPFPEALPHDALADRHDMPLPDWIKAPPIEKGRQESFYQESLYSGNPLRGRKQKAAMERGSLIHRFFEHLPSLSSDQRRISAVRMIERAKIPLTQWDDDIEATLKILDDPAFADIFGPGSLAEVPLIGFVDGLPFAGQIDRLLVTPDRLTIVDYKTDLHPARNLDDVPEVYIKQLENYEKILKSIYPSREIRKIILWTQGPKLQVVG